MIILDKFAVVWSEAKCQVGSRNEQGPGFGVCVGHTHRTDAGGIAAPTSSEMCCRPARNIAILCTSSVFSCAPHNSQTSQTQINMGIPRLRLDSCYFLSLAAITFPRHRYTKEVHHSTSASLLWVQAKVEDFLPDLCKLIIPELVRVTADEKVIAKALSR